MLANLSSSVSSGNDQRRALLVSSLLPITLSQRRHGHCLRLMYHLAGAGCSLVVSILSVDRSLRSVWTRNCDPVVDETWHELEVSFTDGTPFQVNCQ